MIITFGSINVDFVYEVDEMPQPGQTLLARAFRTEAGGKGANQALAAARDGAEVVMVGAVGQVVLPESACKTSRQLPISAGWRASTSRPAMRRSISMLMVAT